MNRIVDGCVGAVYGRAVNHAIMAIALCALVAKGVVAACATCAAADATVPADPRSAPVSAKLSALVDVTRPELTEFSRLAQAGDDAAAMREFVSLLAKRFAALPPQQGYGYWLHAPADANGLLAGRLVTSRYGDQSVHYTAEIGLPGSIDFFKAAPGYPLTIRDISTMHWVNKYAEAYGKTRDVTYLRAWCATWADFAAHWDDQFAAIQKNPDIWGKGPDGQQRVLGMGWVTNTLYVGWRLQAIREGLVSVLQTAAAAGQLDQVDATAIGQLLVRLATHEGPQARSLLGRAESTTPNQARSMAMELFRAGCLFPELKDAAVWRKEPIAVVFLTNLPDGTDREQSLNYFLNYFRELPAQIRRDVPADEQDPALLPRIEQASEYRDRVLPSISRPDGFPPATGTDPVWAKYGQSQKLAPPSRAFTSILFPYGGYAVQRDGWTPESRYLFMKSCRPNKGHWRSQDGGLQLAAFGRNLLASPIGEVYDARDGERGWTLYWNSAVSQNTIVVDGMAAAERKGDFNSLDPLRWHSGGRIDFMETEIRGPYKGPDFRADGRGYAAKRARGEVADKMKSGPEVADVVHRRQVHFLRDAGCWIVTDRITSGTRHDFTQSWCFGPEYAEGEIVVESGGEGRCARIATTQADAPNLSLHQFGIAGLAHRKYFGVYDDDRILGWVGILADRKKWIYTPAVNVHANWRGQGSQLLVTLVVPHEGSERRVTIDSALAEGQGTAAGFDATLTSGLRISFRASTTTAPFEALGVKADAASIVVCRTPDGECTGVALDATTFNSRPASVKDFEFEIPSGADGPQTVAITVPTGFHWEESGAGLQPRSTPPAAAGKPSANASSHRQMHPLVSAELGLDADQEGLLDRGTLPLPVSRN